ncbi:MAG: hypothetical protein HYT16_00130 [DPANN group archaeon]|nr:hypothetical protein [DPANN group archaeon]
MPIFLDGPAGKQKPRPITLKTQEELEDLVRRIGRAAAKRHPSVDGTWIVRLDELDNGEARLFVIAAADEIYFDAKHQAKLLERKLRPYHESGGTFPVYALHLDVCGRLSERGKPYVQEIRTWPSIRSRQTPVLPLHDHLD